MTPRLVRAIALACAVSAAPFPAFAQAPTPTPSAAPAPASMAEAQRRYTRGVDLVKEGSYDAALLEFRRAYDLAPSYKILYNIGQVSRSLNDYATALRSFETYLKDGGSEIPPERAAEVRKEIESLRGRVARVDITSNVVGADVAVDDLVVGKTPLTEPLIVNVGRRRVTLSAAGVLPQSRVVEAAGADVIPLAFELRPAVDPNGAVRPTEASRSLEPTPTPVVPIALWATTGAFAVSAGVVGVLALRARSDHDDTVDRFGVTRGEVTDAEHKTKRLSAVSDVLTGLAVVTGGTALYFSLRKTKRRESAATSTTVVGIAPGGLYLGGRF